MNPQFDSTPGLNLPEPSLTTGSTPPVAPTQVAQPYALPQQPAVPQAAVPQPQTQPIPQAQPSPVAPQPVAQQVQAHEPAPQQAASPTEGDIDQQWINKAKSAITQFEMDPYAQSNALSRIKAEYLQTRHNITTKLGGDS